LTYKEGKEVKPLCLRRVTYRDEKGRIYHFITNNWEIRPEEVALIYKYRWTIEPVFKKLKQNFQLHFFYSDTENGIKTQIWCTLIAHLLLNVIRRLSQTKKAFSTVAALIRIHLISHLDLSWVVTEGRRAYAKRTVSKNKSPAAIQLMLF
jgi:transposase